MQTIKAELLLDIPCEIGEGPLWNPAENKLYWIDIPRGRLYSYDPAVPKHDLLIETNPISAFTFQEDGSLLLFMKAGEVAVLRNGELHPIVPSMPGSEDTIWNDCIADPEGRVFVGMKSGEHHKGQLYRMNLDASLDLLLDGLDQPNGMGFTPDRRGMYFTDTLAHHIYLFDYDKETGDLSNQRVFVEVPNSDGIPDGLTVDANGGIWSAHWDGSCVVRYSLDGEETLRIELPTAKVSSITFGGADYSTLFISTSGGNERSKENALAGSLFQAHPEVQGVPEYKSRIALA